MRLPQQSIRLPLARLQHQEAQLPLAKVQHLSYRRPAERADTLVGSMPARAIDVVRTRIRIAVRHPIVTTIDIAGLHHFVKSQHDDGPQPIEPQKVDSRQKMAKQKVQRPTFHAPRLSTTREGFERGNLSRRRPDALPVDRCRVARIGTVNRGPNQTALVSPAADWPDLNRSTGQGIRGQFCDEHRIRIFKPFGDGRLHVDDAVAIVPDASCPGVPRLGKDVVDAPGDSVNRSSIVLARSS